MAAPNLPPPDSSATHIVLNPSTVRMRYLFLTHIHASNRASSVSRRHKCPQDASGERIAVIRGDEHVRAHALQRALQRALSVFSSVYQQPLPMAPSPGQPKESHKIRPPNDLAVIFVFMVCSLCVLFILWRRADSLRSIVSHQMKTLTQRDGRIRLSEDDGPPSRNFIEEGDIEDDEDEDDDDVPLALRVERTNTVAQAATSKQPEHVVDLTSPRPR